MRSPLQIFQIRGAISRKNANARQSKRTRPWLSLFRPPNLLTVPGDPLAGFLMAAAAGFSVACMGPETGARQALCGGWASGHAGLRAAAAAAASLLLYMHGLLQNDLFDIREDRADRPGRALPSGKAGFPSAIAVCFFLAAAGIVTAGFNGPDGMLAAAALTAAVFMYNGVMKKHPLLGPVSMGMCRSLNFLMGAVAAGWRWQASMPVLASAALLGIYTAAVTAVAAGETRKTETGWLRWGPAAASACGFALVGCSAFSAGIESWPYAVVFGLPASLWAGLTGHRLAGVAQPALIQAKVAQWLRGLLLLQFVLASIGLGGFAAPGIFALLLWLLHNRLARRYNCT